jgi:lipid-A-disaccharide synthase
MAKNIFIIAGEASGDEHSAELVRQLDSINQTEPFVFTGIGGQEMASAGVSVLYPLAKYGVTGLTEVVKQFSHIRKAYNRAKAYITTHKIDLLILVDYPGFNLRFAKLAKKHNIKILYYISPQIWAWKAKRIHTIKKYIDTMAVILPFEKALYQKEEIPAFFVGNPITKTTQLTNTPSELKNKYNLSSNKRIISILPGSRPNEIKQLLPTMLEAACMLDKHHPQKLQFTLPIASSLNTALFEPYLSHCKLDIKLIQRDNCGIELMACADVLMVASGTASLQAALLYKPMVIIYRSSRLTYAIGTQVIQCAYLGLINLLGKKMIVPELIQDDLTALNLFTEVNRFITNDTYTLRIEQQLKKISKMLENKSVDCKLAQLVFEMLTNNQTSTKEASKRK